MVRFKVRSKKPNDTIRQKTPIQEKVPSIVGKTIPQAQKILSRKGLLLGTVKKTTDIERSFDIILKQYPPARKKVPTKTAVTIILNVEEED